MRRQLRSQLGVSVCGCIENPDLSSHFVGEETLPQQEGEDLNSVPRTWQAATPSQILRVPCVIVSLSQGWSTAL